MATQEEWRREREQNTRGKLYYGDIDHIQLPAPTQPSSGGTTGIHDVTGHTVENSVAGQT